MFRYEAGVPPPRVSVDAFHAGAIDHRNCTCDPADGMPWSVSSHHKHQSIPLALKTRRWLDRYHLFLDGIKFLLRC